MLIWIIFLVIMTVVQFGLVIYLMFLSIEINRRPNHIMDNLDERYAAVYHRDSSSPSLYFGPFQTTKEISTWVTDEAQLRGVSVIQLIDPHRWAKLSYDQRWSYPVDPRSCP